MFRWRLLFSLLTFVLLLVCKWNNTKARAAGILFHSENLWKYHKINCYIVWTTSWHFKLLDTVVSISIVKRNICRGKVLWIITFIVVLECAFSVYFHMSRIKIYVYANSCLGEEVHICATKQRVFSHFCMCFHTVVVWGCLCECVSDSICLCVWINSCFFFSNCSP